MFLISQVKIAFDSLEFIVNVPNNEQLTAIYLKSQEIFKKDEISPADFAAMALLVLPCIAGTPSGWEAVPDVTKQRLYFEIAKYLLNECLSVPELKKK